MKNFKKLISFVLLSVFIFCPVFAQSITGDWKCGSKYVNISSYYVSIYDDSGMEDLDGEFSYSTSGGRITLSPVNVYTSNLPFGNKYEDRTYNYSINSSGSELTIGSSRLSRVSEGSVLDDVGTAGKVLGGLVLGAAALYGAKKTYDYLKEETKAVSCDGTWLYLYENPDPTKMGVYFNVEIKGETIVTTLEANENIGDRYSFKKSGNKYVLSLTDGVNRYYTFKPGTYTVTLSKDKDKLEIGDYYLQKKN